MTPLKRLLLFFLIALAVPVQGYAAIESGICMTFGHHDAPARAATHDASVVHAHGDPAQAHEADSDESSAHCGPCAACCGAPAAIAPAMVSMAALSVAARIQVHPDAEPGSLLPAALDRPPLAL
jgi:hypothetical protein